jgi:hypothetical protein
VLATTIPPYFRPVSCAPASRWRQGQALQVLRNLDTAGRGRAIELAGSEGMTASLPHQGNCFSLAYPVCCQSTRASSRWLRQGSAELSICFLAWFIVGQEAAQAVAILPIERERPAFSKNIGIDNAAKEKNLRFTGGNSLPASSAKTCDFGGCRASPLVCRNDGIVDWSEGERDRAGSARVAVNQSGIETLNNGWRFPKIFKFVLNEQSIGADFAILKSAQTIGNIDAYNARINISAFNDRQRVGGFLSDFYSCFSQFRLAIGYARQDISESPDKNRRDGSNSPVVLFQKVDNRPQNTNDDTQRRSPLIPFLFLIAVLCAPILAWRILRDR